MSSTSNSTSSSSSASPVMAAAMPGGPSPAPFPANTGGANKKPSSDSSSKPSSSKKSQKAAAATTAKHQSKQSTKASKADSNANANAGEITGKTNGGGGAKKSASSSATSANGESVSAGATTAAASSKKHSSKQQFKITREKERKEKQLKQTAGGGGLAVETRGGASSPSKATSPAKEAAAAKASAYSPVRLQNMDQDGVKSRNHKLFLAPTRRQSGPCWSGRQVRDLRAESVAETLHDEILEYAMYTRVTVDAMTVHIEQMISHVGRCVRALWPKSQMEPFGSYSTGIWLPSSDVDLVVLGVVEIHDRMLTVKSLRQLARALQSQPWVESIVVLDTAKIPVLKVVTVESSVPIDITFESTATHSGLLARDLIKRYADEMPELYPLAVVFKQLLRERDLNDAYTGGLSSYSVVLMIIHFQLLWRYGDKCFKAAAVFASGSPLPRPAELIAEEERQAREDAKLAAETAAAAANPWQQGAAGAITSSFAAVVTRSKGLKRPASVAGKSGSTTSEDGPPPAAAPPPAQLFSYAAVAAGIAKLSSVDDATKSTPPPPVSYAAAVIAPPTKPKQVAGGPTKSSVKSKTTEALLLDSVSVTSSTADTEESSAHDDTDDTEDHTTTTSNKTTRNKTEIDLMEPPQPQQETELSLGERTMTILEFFGIIFDYRKNGLSIRDGGYIYRLADHISGGGGGSGPTTPSTTTTSSMINGDLSKKLPSLVIEDPIHPDRNVSASSFAFAKVVSVFEDSFYALKYFRPTRFTPSALSCLLSTSGHTLHHHHFHAAQQQQQQQVTKAKTPSSQKRASIPIPAPGATTHQRIAPVK